MTAKEPHEAAPTAVNTNNTCSNNNPTAAASQGSSGNLICRDSTAAMNEKVDRNTGCESTIQPPVLRPQVSGAPSWEDPSTRSQIYNNAVETYIAKVCKVLIMYGAPTHRLERYAHHTAEALGLQLQSFYIPGCMMLSFGSPSSPQRSFHIIRCLQSLDLAKLGDVHTVYKDIIHERTTIEAASVCLDEILDRPAQFPIWCRVLAYGLACAFIGPVSYNAQPFDLPIIFVVGTIIGFFELVLVPRSELYGYVFEISASILASFLGRVFGSIRWGHNQGFCFSAISQASIVMILPGFTITCSALELQSRNMVSGAVRLVYAIVYTLFLSFGFLIGISIYGAMDNNASSATSCSTSYGVWWPITFVIPFTFCYTVVQNGRWSTMPQMLGLSIAGWAVNHFSNEKFGDVQPLSQALGALTVGVLANIYARIRHGLAIALMHPAIYVQVPGSLAASGSLISSVAIADQITKNVTNALTTSQALSTQLVAGYTMVSIGIAITVGLSVGVLLVYPLQKKKRRSGIFSY